MKCAMIFTIFVVVGLSILSGAVTRQERRDLIRPRPDTSAIDPFAPVDLARNHPNPRAVLEQARHDRETSAVANADDTVWTTTANPPIYPSEYNGDVRDLPRVSIKDREEGDHEMYEPQEPPS